MASLLTPRGMLMFPHLFVPRPVVVGGDPRYSSILLFDETSQKDPLYAALKKAVAEAIDAEFGQGKSLDKAWLQKVRFRTPFRDAGEKEYAGFEPGMVFINPWTKEKPGIVDGRVQEISAPSDVWAGQLARMRVRPFAYSTSGNTGASFMLDHVQVVKADMPRMDGRKSAAQSFDTVDEEETEKEDAGLF